MASGVWGRFDEAQKAHEALFLFFSMKDLHGVVGVLVFLSFLLFSFQYLVGHLDPDADIDFVLVIYMQIYPPYLGAIHIHVGLRCMLWDFACFFFRCSFLYLIRETALGG